MTELYSETIGNAQFPPIVMLHGWGQTLENLKPLAHLLASQYHIHLLDLPGFGKSFKPTSVWSSFDYAEHIIAYMNEHQIERAHVLGHSFGGKVALSLAIRYSSRIQNLVLIASSGIKRKRTLWNKMRMKRISGMGKLIKLTDHILKTTFYPFFIQQYGSTDYKNAAEMRPILVRSVNEDLTNELSQIKASTLLLWGEEDLETPVEVAKRMQKQITNSQLLLFPNKGHMPFQDVGSHLCARYILPFLKGERCITG